MSKKLKIKYLTQNLCLNCFRKINSIGSCLVIVIISICFVFLKENLQSQIHILAHTVFFIPGKFVHLRKSSSRSVLHNITNKRLTGIHYPRPLVFPAKIEECI